MHTVVARCSSNIVRDLIAPQAVVHGIVCETCLQNVLFVQGTFCNVQKLFCTNVLGSALDSASFCFGPQTDTIVQIGQPEWLCCSTFRATWADRGQFRCRIQGIYHLRFGIAATQDRIHAQIALDLEEDSSLCLPPSVTRPLRRQSWCDVATLVIPWFEEEWYGEQTEIDPYRTVPMVAVRWIRARHPA